MFTVSIRILSLMPIIKTRRKMLKIHCKISWKEQEIQTMQKMQTSHIKILRMYSYDLPLWLLFLLHVWIGTQRRCAWMQYSLRIELFGKSSLGHWTSGNVLWNKLSFISSMLLFHKLCRTKTCYHSFIVQFIVHNDNLSNHNSRINLFSFVILCLIDNFSGLSIFVSSPQRAVQQSRLLFNPDDILNMWNLWSYHVHVFIVPDICHCNHDRGDQIILQIRRSMWRNYNGIFWYRAGVKECVADTLHALYGVIAQLMTRYLLTNFLINDLFIFLSFLTFVTINLITFLFYNLY